MGDGDYFDSSGGFPENHEVGKPLEHHPAHTGSVFLKLFGVISNSFNSPVNLIEEHFRSP
jgi:hypothetical protein